MKLPAPTSCFLNELAIVMWRILVHWYIEQLFGLIAIKGALDFANLDQNIDTWTLMAQQTRPNVGTEIIFKAVSDNTTK